MSVRAPRAAPVARNLAVERVPVFVGDPAGEAITQGALAGITPSLAGRSGYVYETEAGSMERAFHGYAATPQPELQARTFTGRRGTPSVVLNGPNDVSAVPSTQGGAVFLDARYRALASRMMRS